MVRYTFNRVNASVWEPAAWTRDREKVTRRVRRWRQECWFDDRAERFALSKCRFDGDENMWECTEMLGRGSFGIVGKWTKFDRHGKTLDVIAVKQAEVDQRDLDSHGNPILPMEAKIMIALRQQGCINVAKLRRVCFFPGTRADRSRPKWRFYLDFYRNGTLHDLVVSYQDANRGRHRDVAERIPESFIWQAFNDLAQACCHMRNARLPDRLAPPGDDLFVLHLDLKLKNVLLGEAPKDRKRMEYPTLHISDWGEAEYTSVEDPNNSREWKRHGAIAWYPPEQRDHGHYGESWRDNVLGPANKPYTIKHVVWQIGACILGLMTQVQGNHNLDAHLKNFKSGNPRNEAHLRENNYSPFPSHTTAIEHYSSALYALVEDCVRIDPSLRPGSWELLRRTAGGLRPYTERFLREGETPVLLPFR